MLLEKTMYLVCYSCERSVGSFSWNWSESLTRRRSADTLLKPGVISASTYVLPHSLVIWVLSCGMDYSTLCPGQLHQNYIRIVAVSQLCPLYQTEAEICLLDSSLHQLHQSMSLSHIFTLVIQDAKIPDESLRIWCHGWLMSAMSMSCCQEEQPCLPLPAPITSPVPVLVQSMCTVSFTTELLQPTLGCQNALRSTSLGPEREACSGLTYFVQAPYTTTVCAELRLVHPDPIGDTVHSLDLHSWSSPALAQLVQNTSCARHEGHLL